MAFPPSHSFIFHSHDDHDHLPSPTSLPPQFLQGCGPMMMKRSMSFSGMEKCEEVNGDDDLSDDGSQLGERKKRLNLEQVKALEKSFELGNKLEPERKLQLAKALGLQPRQVAIWFQNRRARWKTKQLEKDYEVLKKQFDALKADNDALQAQNKELHTELLALKNKDSEDQINLKKEPENSWSNGSENSCDINLDISRTTTTTNLSSKHLFSSCLRPTTSMTQVLQGSPRPDLQFLKIDQMVQEDSLCNMFTGVEEHQPVLWPWSDQQQHYH